MLQYIDWAEALHQRRRSLGPEAEYWYIWALVLNRRYEDGRVQIAKVGRRIERAREDGNDPARLDELQRRMDIVKVCLDIFTDHLADAHRNAAHWLAGAETADPFDITAARAAATSASTPRAWHASARHSCTQGRGSRSGVKSW